MTSQTRHNRVEEHEESVDDLRHLVRQCLDGDQAAMLRLVDHFRGQVFGLCYRMLGHRQDAEDVTQETFVRLLRSLHRWDPNRDFEPWLLAIAGNRCRTAISARMRRPTAHQLTDRFADDSEQLQAARILAEEVQLLLGRLRLEYRQSFVLFHEHQLTYTEIAEAMGCPVGTVKTWVHRARQELIQMLNQRDEIGKPDHAVRTV